LSKTKRSTTSSRRPILLILMGLLFLVGAGLIWNMLPTAAPLSPGNQNPPASVDEVERVSITDAGDAHERGQAVFLDVRPAGDYETSHVAGAVSIPLEELTARYMELNSSDWIITYCT
jgi:3-mercaptopyruvate sulfurtransferase SseA